MPTGSAAPFDPFAPKDEVPRAGSTHSRSTIPAPVSVSLDVPTAEVGGVVPYLIGRNRISKPNILWYGNLVALTQTDTESVSREDEYEDSSGNTVTQTVQTITRTTYVIGYTLDMQFGICLGPGAHLYGLYYNSQLIWSGDLGPTRDTVVIDAPETPLHGATLAFNGGNFDQGVDPLLTDADTPAYVGIAYAILTGVRSDTPLSNIQFEVGRYPNPMTLDPSINVKNGDINIATAIHDLVTNDWGGAGAGASSINDTNFTSVAGTLADEDNFCSFAVESTNTFAGILEILQAQAYSFIYQNPETAKVEMALVRQATLSGLLPRFDPTNIVELRNFDKTSWSDTIQKLTAVFADRTNNYEATPINVQNVGLLNSQFRSPRSGKQNYPYVTNATTALSLASRDLSLSSVPLFEAQLVVNRDGANLLPGDIIVLTWPEYNVWHVPVLVTKVRKQPIEQNTVVLSVMQAEFPDQTPIYEVPGDAYDPGISDEPVGPYEAAFFTLPFWIASRTFGIKAKSDTNYVKPIILPTPVNSLQSFFTVYLTNTDNSPGRQVPLVSKGGYSTFGTLQNSIDKYEGWADGILYNMVIENVVNPINMINPEIEGVRNGEIFVFVNNEIMAFEAAYDTGANEFTLSNVYRGLLDTVAQDHSAGSEVYVIGNNFSQVPARIFEFPVGYTPEWKIYSNTVKFDGSLDDALTSTDWTPENRTMCPPRPHNTRVESERPVISPATEIEQHQTFEVTWATRSRIGEIALQTDDAEASEIISGGYQNHTVYFRDNADTEHELGSTVTNANANSLMVTMPLDAEPGLGYLFVKSNLVLPFGTLQSFFDDEVPIVVTEAP